ncbi:MAG: hypothetical protein V7727_17910 [Sneathiella sp.]
MASPPGWIISVPVFMSSREVENVLYARLNAFGCFGLAGPDRFEYFQNVCSLDCIYQFRADYGSGIGL